MNEESYLIIGDIAGNYDPLLRLIDKAHKVYPDAIPFSVGDMCDRGPKSKEVILYFKENGIALKGNHEHMLLDFYYENGFYDDDTWFYNGGGATLKSLAPNNKSLNRQEARAALNESGIVEYLENLIYFFETAPRDDGLRALITHAPLAAGKDLYQACVLGRGFESMDYHIAKSSIIWNRQQPGYRKNYIQVFGHNSPWGHTWFQEKSAIEGSKEIIPWGVCLDSSSDYSITAMHWPSLEIFQEKYYV